MFAKLLGISTEGVSQKLFVIFGAIVLLSLFIGAATNFYFLALLPVVLQTSNYDLCDFAFALDIYHDYSFLRLFSFCKIFTRKILVCLCLLFHGRATYQGNQGF